MSKSNMHVADLVGKPTYHSSFVAPAVVSSPDAALYLGVTNQTLRNWRRRGMGPDYVKLEAGNPASRVYYRISDLDSWLADNTVHVSAKKASE